MFKLTMDKLALCRICLNSSVQHMIKNTHLEKVYEKLTAMPFQTNDMRPLSVCYMCYAQLRNTYKFMLKCLTAENLLIELLNLPVNTEEETDVKATLIDRLKLSSGLSVSPIVTVSSTDDDHDEYTEIEDVDIKKEMSDEQDVDAMDTDHVGESPDITIGPTMIGSQVMPDDQEQSFAVSCKIEEIYDSRDTASAATDQLYQHEEYSDDQASGSEDEEEDEGADDECDWHPRPVPRTVRIFFAADEDTPQEAEAAGTVGVDSPSVESLASAQNTNEVMNGPTSLFDFKWEGFPTSPIPPNLRRETFVGTCGPMIDSIPSPYEAFSLIWDRPIMEHIVVQTNLYAQQYAQHLLELGEIGPSSQITLWRDTNIDELYIFFALVMTMGILVKSKLEDYWSTDKNIFSTPGFSINMSLKRFQLLSRCLHYNDNSNISPSIQTRSQAKIHKITPIVDHLNAKFSSLYGLGQNIALDESLTQWKGWLDIKQFIPNKAAAVGIKTYEVCDSRTGYLWRFECHVGNQIEVEQVVMQGSIPNLVLRLLRGLENRGHTVWMDNYYNSPALARILKSLGYDCVGTLRANRQFVPEQITNLKKGDMRVGQVCGCTSGDVDLMVWRDQNRVAMISTYHGIAVSEDKPILIKDYNVCMGGVDKKDQMLSAYPLERKKTQVWYKKIVRRLLNVSVFNAYILYKHTHDITHREFRMGLITEILQQHLQTRPDISMAMVRGVPKFSAEVISHLPAELPAPGGDTIRKPRRLCVVCKSKRSHYICRACNVSLCVNFSDTTSSCFIRYHT